MAERLNLQKDKQREKNKDVEDDNQQMADELKALNDHLAILQE